MQPDTNEARTTRLRATRDRLEAQLADPKTPPYSIAPLSNQLRLTDKELDRIQRREEEADDGLPTTPERANLLHFFRYRTRRYRMNARINDYVRREEAIYDSWNAAGFTTPERAYSSADLRGDELRAAVDSWVVECRAELTRCLETGGRRAQPSHQPEGVT